MDGSISILKFLGIILPMFNVCSVSSAVDDAIDVVSMTVAKLELLADDSASGVSVLRLLVPFAPCLPVMFGYCCHSLFR